VHTRPRLRHHANPEKPTRSGLLSYETLNAGQATLTTDQKVGSSNLSGRAGQVPRFGGGSAGFGYESDAGRRRSRFALSVRSTLRINGHAGNVELSTM
jgi:hypothetical protein